MKDRTRRLKTQIEDLELLRSAFQLNLIRAKQKEQEAIDLQMQARNEQKLAEAQMRSFEFRIELHEEELAKLNKSKSKAELNKS